MSPASSRRSETTYFSTSSVGACLRVAVHPYIGSVAEIRVDEGDSFYLTMETQYPLEGVVALSFGGLLGREVSLLLRTPFWLTGEPWSLELDGIPLDASEITGSLRGPTSRAPPLHSSPHLQIYPPSPYCVPKHQQARLLAWTDPVRPRRRRPPGDGPSHAPRSPGRIRPRHD